MSVEPEELTPQERDVYELARPYLTVRNNDLHALTSLGYALQILGIAGGDRQIVAPAIILHDVGWFMLREEEFERWRSTPNDMQLVRIHEEKGGEIAGAILERTGYENSVIQEIVRIVKAHDSGGPPESRSEAVVRDADVLWRYSREGFWFIVDMFRSTPGERLEKLVEWLDDHFFLAESREIAEHEMQQRRCEIESF